MRLLRLAPLLVASMTFVALTSTPNLAVAQPSAQDRASARQLAEEGQKRLEAKDYRGALDYLLRADSLVPAPTVKVRIAKAYEALGQLLEAYELLMSVSREPGQSNDPPWYKEARDGAGGDAAKIYGRLPSITIRVEPATAKADITVDGKPMNAALLGVPAKFNPGTHTVVVSAVGFEQQQQTIQIAEAENKTASFRLLVSNTPPPRPSETFGVVSLTITGPTNATATKIVLDGVQVTDQATLQKVQKGRHSLRIESAGFEPFQQDIDVAAGQTSTLNIALSPVKKPAPVKTDVEPSGRSSAWMWTGFGVGAVGLTVGSITGAMSLSKVSDLDSKCLNKRCTPSEQSNIDSAKTLGNVSTVAFIVGGVGLGFGLYELFSTPPKNTARYDIRVTAGGASFEGAF